MLLVSASRKYQRLTGLPSTAPLRRMKNINRTPPATRMRESREKSDPDHGQLLRHNQSLSDLLPAILMVLILANIEEGDLVVGNLTAVCCDSADDRDKVDNSRLVEGICRKLGGTERQG
jgi:hypothetical protein